MMDYYVWLGDTEDDGYAWLTPYLLPALNPQDFRLKEGERCAGWFPKDFVVPLDPEKGKKLTNAVPNTRSWVLVDEKARTLLDGHTKEGTIEYLSVRIQDLRKEVVDRPYWIANVLSIVDCADMSRSQFRMSNISRERVARFAQIVLDPARLTDDAPIFRLANKPELILVRHDLCRAFVEADITGVMFIDLEHYGAEFRSA